MQKKVRIMLSDIFTIYFYGCLGSLGCVIIDMIELYSRSNGLYRPTDKDIRFTVRMMIESWYGVYKLLSNKENSLRG